MKLSFVIDAMPRDFVYDESFEFARARKMSISTITNNLKRFESIYEDDFYTLINHIDTQCLLGTNLKIDIEYFSELLGIDKSFIKDDLDRDKLLIYEKGLAPILADKYYFFQNEDWVKILKNK